MTSIDLDTKMSNNSCQTRTDVTLLIVRLAELINVVGWSNKAAAPSQLLTS